MGHARVTAKAHDTLPPLPALLAPVSVERNPSQPAYDGCGGATATVVNAAYEQEVVERVNSVRADHGLPPLKRVVLLDDAARYHATDMGQDNYFDHDTYDRSEGNLVLICQWSSRIQSYYAEWWSLAENIAAGYSSPESVMNGWMNSSGHRANILGLANWEIGVGYFEGSGSYHRYWVQDFGRRNNVYPLIINREAATTDSRDVSLYVYGDWQEIRLRNEDDPWTDWGLFQTIMDWTLNSGQGEHVVRAEMRSGADSAATSDTVYLTVSPPVLGSLPAALQFTYSIPDERLSPASHRVAPQNIGNEDLLAWRLTTEGDWHTAIPINGTTPASFWISPTNFVTDAVVTYTGVITVTVINPPDTERSPHRIDLGLQVVDVPFFYVHLPIALHNYASSPLSNAFPHDRQ
jgi:uncharacterized protein YkwD